MCILLTCLVLGAPAIGADPPDLMQDLGDGVRINWTTLQLEVEAFARSPTTPSLKAVEQLARREVQAVVEYTVRRIPLTSSTTVADLLDGSGGVPDAMHARIGRWEVRQTIYGTSGSVRLGAELSLQDVLKPWVLSQSDVGVVVVSTEGYSGLIVDARGIGAGPAYAPTLTGPDHAVLFSGGLDEVAAVTVAPYVFVTDPAHAVTARAGDHPLIVRAVRAKGADLVLSRPDALAVAGLRERLKHTGVVVVLDGD